MLLLKDSHRVALYTDLVNMQPHSKLTREALTSRRRRVQLPARATTHPVTLARLMLTFAITLQSPSGHQIAGLCEPQGVLMRRLVAAATTWVTTKHDMHTSIDSLACILLEAVYEINCGHLRRAWAVYRRAMTVAQLMGLHRPNIGPVQRIDDQDDTDPEFMWFRIVYMDRYLSLLLGLPQGTPDKSIGPAATLRQEPPLGKFERLLTVIASRILERNESPFHLDDSATTKSIDNDLLSVSIAMPSSFWRPISFHGHSPGSPDTLLETVRLSAHVYYYSLLIQLHLPYMVQGIAANSASDDDYSKTTCANASREIITRFIAHRTFNPKSLCSRPVDFFALLAAMTLILAHLNTRHHPAAAKHLAHHRSTDRALLEQTLERVQFISSLNSHDAIYENSAALIHSLLQIEASGEDCYIADRSDEMHLNAERGQLHLQIPYIGRIKITRQNPTVMREASQNSPLSPGLPASAQYSSSNAVLQTTPQQTDRRLRGHANASSSNVGNSERVSIVEQSSTFAQSPEVYTASSTQYSPVNPSNPFMQQQQRQRQHMAHFSLQGADGVDDWTLEGVDMAFFDNLLRGARDNR
ncbi:hypothetical protein VHEMI09254 [[Torrubiella] hemipterigena]|nr:hypothetical protein VHEMI09254 [[Torrubiella] hemipterigena]